MSVKYDVLAHLENHRGEILSGAVLARDLRVTRNSVWKAINSLREDGYRIEGVTNAGYTMLSSNDLLSAQSIQKYLCEEVYKLRVFSTIDSTNTALKKMASEGAVEGTVLIAEEQTAGKGRLGRTFVSPRKTGLYMSILLRPQFSVEESLCITTAAAVAVAEVIEEISGKETKIKWVNDIYLNDKKVCGILTEASINFENGGLEYAVLGIGINAVLPNSGFPEGVAAVAGAVWDEAVPDEGRSKLAAGIIKKFFAYYQKIPDRSYIEKYRKRSFLADKQVTMVVGSREETGIVMDIDSEARLVVRLLNGAIEAFSAGEANIKK
ncbi:MAG: biotin--[acetyl-CoA-carboxylase] ligase [Oscillospiraceae bacterium]